jgi:putative peptide zinc metalloprotease protein
MAVERPTFHEAWYRVASLRPRLASGVRVHRQHFRGQMWHVLENPANNKFSRVSPEAYRFLGLLDGRRPVAEAWQLTNDQLGDRAPTQGEVIQLLGQLYCANLLYAEVAPDTASLFNRYQSRLRRQVQSFLTNLLFVRIPLIDPDAFLDRWVGLVGKLFTRYGFVLWLVLVTAGLYYAIGNIGELVDSSSNVLAPDNLVLLYLSFVVVKVFHEFGHAFACKRFGVAGGNGGQVHVMGIMLLVFVPVPYMDASSSWAFRSKWHRALVGAAGVLVELAVAAVAAIVWANTSAGTVHAIAYNAIFVASVSTLIFNGNPLLRFDAYYVLSDLIEIPNLGQRSRGYLYYLVKRYVWGVRNALNPAHTGGERVWFVVYGVASTAYRIYICIRILLFLNDRLPEELFILVPIFALSAIVMWVLVPIGKFLRYLATSPELGRTRLRAVGTTALALLVLVACLGVVPVPDHCRVEGVVEPVRLALVHAESSGFVERFLPSGTAVSPDGPPIVEAENPELEARRKILEAELRGLEIERRLAEAQEQAAAQIVEEKIDAVKEQLARVESELAALRLRAPFRARWISPEIDRTLGIYLKRGQQIGFVADLDDVRIRATAGQPLAALIVEHAYPELEMRVRGRPDVLVRGRIEKVLPAGLEVLPAESLGYAAGGTMPTAVQDPYGVRTAERFFEVRIRPAAGEAHRLLTGQRVVARIRMPAKPLAAQWWRSVRQLLQRRFRI